MEKLFKIKHSRMKKLCFFIMVLKQWAMITKMS